MVYNLTVLLRGCAVSNEDVSIIEEINEELKNDQQMAFLKKHSNTILGAIAVIVVGIVIYSSLHERKKRDMEDITNALLSIVQNPESKSDVTISKLLDEAPAELRPILTIMKSGKKLITGEFTDENLRPLLDLSNRHGVDIVWKDLALLIYASYPTKSPSDLIKLLEPLTANDRPFRFTAIEFTGMLYESESKHDKALECFDKIIKDKEAPKTLKDRISVLANYIKNDVSETNNGN
jgi:hypothetical protein